MNMQDFTSIGLPWPLIVDLSIVFGGLSVAWFLIQYMSKNYTTIELHHEFEEKTDQKFEHQSKVLDVQLEGIKKELHEIKEDVRSQSKAMTQFMINATKGTNVK